jgi:hypothetical protein
MRELFMSDATDPPRRMGISVVMVKMSCGKEASLHPGIAGRSTSQIQSHTHGNRRAVTNTLFTIQWVASRAHRHVGRTS